MNVHIVMHESFEAPGAIEEWIREKGHTARYTRLYLGDALPIDASSFDFLVVLGGPQSPATTQQECPHYNAAEEIRLIKDAISQGKKVLGACLGAQLIGEALQASFDHSPHKELGVFPITLTQAGKRDAFFGTLPETFNSGHWHSDMPGLSPEAEILAYSEGCPRQIVRYTPNVYGFQCHMEFNSQVMEGLIEEFEDEISDESHKPYVQSVSELRSKDYDQMNEFLFRFLDYFTKS